ncbi:hypothetical protein BDZ45DRAFT_692762 [Acephala macrosclerotiorum]|nr:hypothetical protein BDZ45DRAFT_692762 [Acephala macrosclerotiorum]
MPQYRITSLLTFATLILYATSAIIPERNTVDIGAISDGVTTRGEDNTNLPDCCWWVNTNEYVCTGSVDIGAIGHVVTARKKLDIDAGIIARGGGPTCRRSIGNKGARGGCYDGSSKRGDDGGCC